MTRIVDMRFSEKFDLLTKEKGFTRRSLSQALDGDVSPSTISNWANGTSYPPLDVAARLARLLGVTLDYLGLDEIEARSPSGVSESEAFLLRLIRAVGEDVAVQRLVSIDKPKPSKKRPVGAKDLTALKLTEDERRSEKQDKKPKR